MGKVHLVKFHDKPVLLGKLLALSPMYILTDPMSLTKMVHTGEVGYDGPLYASFLHMTHDMLGPSPLHIKYSSYVYNRFCI